MQKCKSDIIIRTVSVYTTFKNDYEKVNIWESKGILSFNRQLKHCVHNNMIDDLSSILLVTLYQTWDCKEEILINMLFTMSAMHRSTKSSLEWKHRRPSINLSFTGQDSSAPPRLFRPLNPPLKQVLW